MNTNVPANAITAINGMRVLSMWWVILGHTYAFQQATPLSKYLLTLLTGLLISALQLSPGWLYSHLKVDGRVY